VYAMEGSEIVIIDASDILESAHLPNQGPRNESSVARAWGWEGDSGTWVIFSFLCISTAGDQLLLTPLFALPLRSVRLLC
jgi:hypothetical protein